MTKPTPLSAMFDQMPIGVLITGLEGRVVMINPAAGRMFGGDCVEFPGGALEPSVAGELLSGARSSFEREQRYERPDGTSFLVRRVVSMMREDGEPRYFLNLIEDITEHRESQRCLVDAQKMEVVGRLAAGFAHDFSNLLTVINGYSHMLLTRMSLTDEGRRELQEVKRASERAIALTQRLITFGQQDIGRPERLDLNHVVVALDQLLGYIAGGKIRVVSRLNPDLGPIECDATQIEQVILNLAINARDAMPDGGELVIATGHAHLEAGETGAPQECVALTIADTGCGMDEATKARIFEPFFTTKPPGKGTGLGLWMVSEIVRQSSGSICVYSSPGRGTTFRLCFPRVSADGSGSIAALSESVTGDGLQEGSAANIAVADDDAGIREYMRHVLTDAGFRVFEAADGNEALCVLRREKIDLLITDLIMPDREGFETIQAVKDHFPGVPVIAMSGGRGAKFLEIASKLGAAGILTKPFAADTVVSMIRRLLVTQVPEVARVSEPR